MPACRSCQIPIVTHDRRKYPHKLKQMILVYMLQHKHNKHIGGTGWFSKTDQFYTVRTVLNRKRTGSLNRFTTGPLTSTNTIVFLLNYLGSIVGGIRNILVSSYHYFRGAKYSTVLVKKSSLETPESLTWPYSGWVSPHLNFWRLYRGFLSVQTRSCLLVSTDERVLDSFLWVSMSFHLFIVESVFRALRHVSQR